MKPNSALAVGLVALAIAGGCLRFPACSAENAKTAWNQPEVWEQFPPPGEYKGYEVFWLNKSEPPRKYAASGNSSGGQETSYNLEVDNTFRVTFSILTSDKISDARAYEHLKAMYDKLGLRPYPSNLKWERDTVSGC